VIGISLKVKILENGIIVSLANYENASENNFGNFLRRFLFPTSYYRVIMEFNITIYAICISWY